MTDIATFKKILEQPYAAPTPHAWPHVTWLAAYKSNTYPGRFLYRVGSKNSLLSKFFSYSLSDARALAKSFGLPVHELGPPEAFGRKRDTYSPAHRPSAATVAAFWHVVSLDDVDQLAAWLRNHLQDAPFLFELVDEGAK